LVFGRMSYPKVRFWSPHNGPDTRTDVTVKVEVLSGSAVAVKPWSTQPWLPWDTATATGRFVRRMRAAAIFSAFENVS